MRGYRPQEEAHPGGPGEGVGEEEPSGPLDLGGRVPHVDRQLPGTGEPHISIKSWQARAAKRDSPTRIPPSPGDIRGSGSHGKRRTPSPYTEEGEPGEAWSWWDAGGELQPGPARTRFTAVC